MTIHGWPLPSKVMWQGAYKGPYGYGGRTRSLWAMSHEQAMQQARFFGEPESVVAVTG